jgi:hypothetical protein
MAFWLVFVACEVVGVMVPSFANIHHNIAPLFAGLLLAPGLILLLIFNSFRPELVAIAIVINGACWYAVSRWSENPKK